MSGDDLRSGTWVTFAGGRPRDVRVRRCRLEVVGGPDEGLIREIEAPLIRIGARRGNDLQLGDGKVSGLHCELALEERGYRLRDVDSTNGTYVAGLRVNDVYIAPGMVFQVGGTKVRFQPLDESVAVDLSSRDHFGGLYGCSVAMRELFARLEKLAPSDATVLISGETGVGKELVAEALHEHSSRAPGPFVVLDCGSIPQSLIESELFGHERGAFTGAVSPYAGAFERADGGTLFLDEIGELPLSMQPKLLRALERREVRRLGGADTISVDIRVVAATNRDLGVEVNRGRFREDLYYRIAVARVNVPPLRARKDDIPLLVEHFLTITPNAQQTQISAETIEIMSNHDWPGNVRELRNVIERAVLLSESPADEAAFWQSVSPEDGPEIEQDAAPEGRERRRAAAARERTPSDAEILRVPIDTDTPFKLAKQRMVQEFERRYIRSLLEAHRGNVSAAARAAGIDRMSIHKMLNRLGIDNPGRDS